LGILNLIIFWMGSGFEKEPSSTPSAISLGSSALA
jgi:hypothetical protein